MTRTLYVPSRGRALTSATLRSLNEERIPARVFVPVEEVAVYAREYPALDVIWSESQKRGVSAVRDAMLRFARMHQDPLDIIPWMWMLDDDISEVYIRDQRASFEQALLELEDERHHWPTVGLFGPMIHQWAKLHGRDSRNCSIQSFFSMRLDINWNFWPYYLEDVDLAMQVLSSGFGVAKTARVSFVASRGGMGSQKGGCFDGYQAGLGAEAVEKMIQKWGTQIIVGRKVWPNGTRSVRPRRAAFPLPERKDLV